MELYKLSNCVSIEVVRIVRSVLVLALVGAGVWVYTHAHASETGAPVLTPIAARRKMTLVAPPPGYVWPGALPSAFAAADAGLPGLRHVCVDTHTHTRSAAAAHVNPADAASPMLRNTLEALSLFKHTSVDVLSDDSGTLAGLKRAATDMRSSDLLLVTHTNTLTYATPREIAHAFMTATAAERDGSGNAKPSKKRGILIAAAADAPPSSPGGASSRPRGDARSFIGRASLLEGALLLAAANDIDTYAGFVALLERLAAGDTEDIRGCASECVHVVVDVDAALFHTLTASDAPGAALEFDPAYQRWKAVDRPGFFSILVVDGGARARPASLLGAAADPVSHTHELLRMIKAEACPACMRHHPYLAEGMLAAAGVLGLWAGLRGVVTLWSVLHLLLGVLDPLLCLLYMPCARACGRESRVEVKAT